MPQPSVQEILKDPEFLKLIPDERQKVMRSVDPEFAALPDGEQAKVVRSFGPIPITEPPGFFQRLYENSPVAGLAQIGHAFVDPMAAHKLGEAGLESLKRNWEEFGRAGGSLQHGDIPGAAFHYAGAVPFVGEPAQRVATDLEAGNVHGAAGGGLGLIGSAALLGRGGGRTAEVAPEIPPPPATPGLLRTLVTDPQLRTDALGLVSPRMAHAVAGVRRVGRIADRIKELSQEPAPEIPPPPKAGPSTQRSVSTSAIPPTEVIPVPPPPKAYSTQRAVKAPPQPVPEPPPKPGPSTQRKPGVSAIEPTPIPPPPKAYSTNRPMGGSGTANTSPVTATSTGTAGILDDLSQSLAGKNFDRLTPKEQATIQTVAQRIQEQAPEIPKPPFMLSPEPANAAGFKHSARHTDLLRQFHAQGKELDLGPGSPAGKQVSLTPTAQALYGVKGAELTTPQLEAIVEFLNTQKRLPVPADLKAGTLKLPIIPPR